jgi:hypothetical protein
MIGVWVIVPSVRPALVPFADIRGFSRFDRAGAGEHFGVNLDEEKEVADPWQAKGT